MEAELRRDRFDGSEQRLREALQRYGLTEPELREQLLWQITVLQFINQRFRGGVVVTDDDVRGYYDQHVAELRREYPKDNSFEALEPKIRTTLEGERINQSFNEWLDQARKSERVEFKQGALRGRIEMSRPFRILRNVAIALGALILVLAVAGVLVVRSAWFQNYVKQTIITSIEDSTGGKAEIGTFHFEWKHLTAVVTDFVIHGTEPAELGAPASRRASAVESPACSPAFIICGTSLIWGWIGPQANVIVYPDGHTNIPSPRRKSTSSNSPLETVVDLAIGRFELTNGLITLAAQKHELNVRGNNLRAQLSYNILSQEYRGQISLQPVYVVSGRNTPVDFTVNLPVVLSRNRIDVHDASIFSSASAITLNASIQDLKNPKVSAHATGHIALADLKNAANLPLSLKARTFPP